AHVESRQLIAFDGQEPEKDEHDDRKHQFQPEPVFQGQPADQKVDPEMALFAHRPRGAQEAEPDEEQLRRIDRPDERMAEGARDRRQKDKGHDGGQKQGSDKEFKLGETAEHESPCEWIARTLRRPRAVEKKRTYSLAMACSSSRRSP